MSLRNPTVQVRATVCRGVRGFWQTCDSTQPPSRCPPGSTVPCAPPPLPSPTPCLTAGVTSCLHALPFPEHHIVGILQCVPFQTGLPKFPHVSYSLFAHILLLSDALYPLTQGGRLVAAPPVLGRVISKADVNIHGIFVWT